jgi:RNA methyltransferase, TrmH family
MTEKITSLQNARIKNIVKLQEKSQERRSQKRFVVEGKYEIQQAIASGLKIDSIYYCPAIIDAITIEDIKSDNSFEVSEEVFRKIAYREDSGGVILLIEMPASDLDSLKLSHVPLIVVLEAVEKPGNLGAILRTADAAGVDAVLVCDARTDVWNPNVIRSSIGCVFSVPVIPCTSEQAYGFLKKNNIAIHSAALVGSKQHDHVSFQGPSAIVMGTEADGLSRFWLDNADHIVRIPMLGRADSLNVSTSCAIIVFEALRQRAFNKFESSEKYEAFLKTSQ